MSRNDFRRQQNEARLLAMRKATVKVKTEKGDGTYSESGTATRIVYCPTCKSPVVDSSEGRKGHFQRCRCEGMGRPV